MKERKRAHEISPNAYFSADSSPYLALSHTERKCLVFAAAIAQSYNFHQF